MGVLLFIGGTLCQFPETIDQNSKKKRSIAKLLSVSNFRSMDRGIETFREFC